MNNIQVILVGLFSSPNRESFEPKDINDPHYHANCELEEYCIPHTKPQREVLAGKVYFRVNKFEGFKCKQHGVTVHKDGWEVGWWGGTNSKEIWETAARQDILKRNKLISLAKQKLKQPA